MRRLYLVGWLLFVVMSVAVAGSPIKPFEVAGGLEPANRIDELVFAVLKAKGIPPARLCSDAVFLRRVYLDVIGTLPTMGEAHAFLQSKAAHKRAKLIDDLLKRDAYADYRAMRWADLLRIKAEFPINMWPNAVQAYYRWLHDALKNNMPYDKFAREMLTSSGSNFRVPPVNFYRSMQNTEPEMLTRAVALTFMGARTEKWDEAKREGMTAFFSQVGFKRTAEWKEEVVHHAPWLAETNAPANQPLVATFPDGKVVKLKGEDPRRVFADWLITADNPSFAPVIANRVWFWLLGRGIVHEPDDFRSDNPPVNPELLAWLAAELTKADYDLKHLYRLILNSKTYQLSSIPASEHAEAAAHFAHYPVRRLDAEVLIDAICQITGSTEKYESRIPEPFTFIPAHQRSIALADGSISSPFLDMFGRPPRDTGLASERNNKPTDSQRLHLLNSSHIRDKLIRSGKLKKAMKKAKPGQIVNRFYLIFLSRYPTEKERETILAYHEQRGVNKRFIPLDVAWSLINSKEFLYRH